jgi:uncharacterized peroxidase-related enzyme
MLAHGAVLRKSFFSAEQVAAIARDFRNAGLPDDEVAMMAYAQQVILSPHEVSQEDIDRLRSHDFSDAEILDIALVAAVRSFYSKVIDALGTPPDEHLLDIDDDLRQALVVGRPAPPAQ